ncbi:hypothetical protein AC249_AIPGENE4557 [Exaiptasia diaphana]|nr:hypothetical protein AC249_AIPGENE4557 [Exaiptasia diaphana]
MDYDRKRIKQRSAEHVRRNSLEQFGSDGYQKRFSRTTLKKQSDAAMERFKYGGSAPPRFPNYEAKAVEQQQLAITAMLNEKEDSILQKLKDKQALNDWRDKTRKLRQQKQHLAKYKKPLKVDVNAPYGTEKNIKEEKPNTQYVVKLKEILEDKDKNAVKRALRERDLEDRIRNHMEKIQVHRRKTYEDISEELESARRNLEQAQKFQKELEERRSLEYRLRAYTGEEIPLAKGQITRKKK